MHITYLKTILWHVSELGFSFVHPKKQQKNTHYLVSTSYKSLIRHDLDPNLVVTISRRAQVTMSYTHLTSVPGEIMVYAMGLVSNCQQKYQSEQLTIHP